MASILKQQLLTEEEAFLRKMQFKLNEQLGRLKVEEATLLELLSTQQPKEMVSQHSQRGITTGSNSNDINQADSNTPNGFSDTSSQGETTKLPSGNVLIGGNHCIASLDETAHGLSVAPDELLKQHPSTATLFSSQVQKSGTDLPVTDDITTVNQTPLENLQPISLTCEMTENVEEIEEEME
ncbi:uncharacterized protein LOC116603553 [Nematostella vectensis]|uniref:uncharacterized protein LOC116603553 n=1 Tax=Nematostella vectensis TaxID=45351 RepID=UPI002076E064|nr:uncharacterized protein LOC116603553 [Nematostella vectensis]